VTETIAFTLDSGGVGLDAHLSRPAGIARVPGLVLCHGFPSGPRGAATAGITYPELGERLTRETGWAVLTFNFRGTGASSGDFSIDGWRADVAAAVDVLAARDDLSGISLAGASTGGALAVVHAADDPRIRGVAILGSPATLRHWVRDPSAFLVHARNIGIIRDPRFPPDPVAWAAAIAELDPLAAAARLAPRSLLIVHGSDDEVVPISDARAYAAAAGDHGELRIVQAGGPRLRHDPRAVATLIGWLARQST
jgi:uncharacterized protein